MRHDDIDKEELRRKIEWILQDKGISLHVMSARTGIGERTLRSAIDPNDHGRLLTKTRDALFEYIKRNYREES